jgi:hypothetical protein
VSPDYSQPSGSVLAADRSFVATAYLTIPRYRRGRAATVGVLDVEGWWQGTTSVPCPF